MKTDYKRFEINLRSEYSLENDIVTLYQNIPERSRSGIFRRQILAALDRMDQLVLAGDAPDHTSALFILAREFGLSNLDISTYLPDFDFTLIQDIDLKAKKSIGVPTQNLRENGMSQPSELKEECDVFVELTAVQPLQFKTVNNQSNQSEELNTSLKTVEEIEIKDDLRKMLDW